MIFWDSSAVLPLLIEEEKSKRSLEVLSIDSDMWVWWGSTLECHSALSRRNREGSLTTEDYQSASESLYELSGNWNEILPSDQVRERALRLVSVHPLRAADSLQLAAALIMCEGFPRGEKIVTYDKRLAEACAREGFSVVG